MRFAPATWDLRAKMENLNFSKFGPENGKVGFCPFSFPTCDLRARSDISNFFKLGVKNGDLRFYRSRPRQEVRA